MLLRLIIVTLITIITHITYTSYYIYSYELTNPDNLTPEGLHNMLQYVYRRCLCCFRYHPEVWLSFAEFEYSHGYPGEARTVLSQGAYV